MRRDYNFYIPEPEDLTLFKIDHWEFDTNEFWGQHVSPNKRIHKNLKISDVILDKIDNYALFDEDDSNYADDMFIFNIGFIKDAIYIYNKLTDYYEMS